MSCLLLVICDFFFFLPTRICNFLSVTFSAIQHCDHFVFCYENRNINPIKQRSAKGKKDADTVLMDIYLMQSGTFLRLSSRAAMCPAISEFYVIVKRNPSVASAK